MVKLMDGTKLAVEIRENVRRDVQNLCKTGIEVGLALLLAGDNSASCSYFNATVKISKSVGINVFEYKLPTDVSLNEILNIVSSINADERINGLLVLFPLPKRINPRRVVNAIVPDKDVDGLGSVSVGRLSAEESMFQLFGKEFAGSQHIVQKTADFSICTSQSFLPCTPFGVIRLLEYYGVDIVGKNAVVIGKSLAVGKPLSMMLLAKEATVSVCHKSTANLKDYLINADIVCSATGMPGLITGDMIKEGAIVVDIGINVQQNGKIIGDIDFNSVAKKASLITPVPGGVGPVTIATLLENTVRSAKSNALLNNPLLLH
ncbi:MAG: bifunctional 5,10-methylenetetrahydrofolate dehydrogenase/5,10-methenyltetrahydrofolate cyclohydrolase [Nitrospirae bacterium]|nr:bifunctional 5,10-methylenetetrahydrofolate dehydrogenase/5,10-methenyltetrahydrofolate cyclohydrolase [Nitrospirota bacterium]